MKIATILGTRPEIIRLSRILPKLDSYCDHILIHTGQNYDRTLNELFFAELGLRVPDHVIDSRSESAMEQIGKILFETEKILVKEKPDRILILGDTNSGLTAMIAKRMGIQVHHMEAGNRCFDPRVPEEINRKIIDHSSDILYPYTQNSKQNLIKEGIELNHILVSGNPIFEILNYYKPKIDSSNILSKLKIKEKQFFLVTMHRSENVDKKERLVQFIDAFKTLYNKYGFPIIISMHPRTIHQLKKNNIDLSSEKGFILSEPFGFFDFVKLEKHAFCVLSDSGTVQEEACILGTPNVTIRDVTERPETIESGSNILTGASPENIVRSVEIVLTETGEWTIPPEYIQPNVSSIIIKSLLGYNLKDGK